MTIESFVDYEAYENYGMTLTDAYIDGVCIRCRLDIPTGYWTQDDYKEYALSGLCPKCYEIEEDEIEDI